MAVRFKNRGGSASVRGRVRSPHVSGGPVAGGGSAAGSGAMGQTERRTDGRTDRAISKCPLGWGHNNLLPSLRPDILTLTKSQPP